MEKHNKNWQVFFIGILIGIIAGGTIVWLEMKDENRNFLSQILFELNTLKLEKRIAEDEQQKEKSPSVKTQKAVLKEVKPAKKEFNSGLNENPDSINRNNFYIDSLAISEKINDTPDTMNKDSDLVTSQNIVVKKDRLVFSTVLKLKNKDDVAQSTAEKDTLVEEISGLHEAGEKKEFLIEFWESPINYKGYKMGNRKIILFGIGIEFENISLIQLNKKIYLKYYESIYQLEDSYSFEPFKKISDKSLLAKME